jgi:hypothetical protein
MARSVAIVAKRADVPDAVVSSLRSRDDVVNLGRRAAAFDQTLPNNSIVCLRVAIHRHPRRDHSPLA